MTLNNSFREKVKTFWQASALARESMAVKALSLYKTRVNISTARVLEIGCGTGDFSIELAKAGASVIALDLSMERIEVVRKKALEKGINLDLYLGDAEETTFPDETFDLILCRSVIEHVNNPKQLIKEMARILKPNGAIQLTAPNRYSISQILRDEHYRLPLVVILPRKVAAFIVCKVFSLEDKYSVSVIPSFKLLKKWTKANNLAIQMDMPDKQLIKEKWCNYEKVNNKLIKVIIRAVTLLGINKMIANIASSERFLGYFACDWSLWITKI